MSYNNFGYSRYNSYDPYMPQNYSYQQTINPMPAKTDIIKVNGKNGVDAFQLAPNSSALLLDANMPIVWFVQTDGAGYKTSTPYKIEPYQEEQPANVSDLEKRIKRLEDLINAKPDHRSNESGSPTAIPVTSTISEGQANNWNDEKFKRSTSYA